MMEELCRILVVTDDVESGIGGELDALGCRFETVTSGDIALQRLRLEGFDIALIDYRTPRIDGTALLQKVKDERISTVPIMIIPVGGVSEAVESMKLGAFDFVYRNVDKDLLFYILYRACEHRRGQKEAEHLSLTAMELEAILDGIPNMIMVLDGDLRIVQCNQETLKRLDMAKEEVIGKKCPEIFMEEPCVAGIAPCTKALNEGTSVTREVYLRRCRGYFEVTCLPLQRDGGAPFLIRIARDITDKKKAEDERNRLEDQLRQSQKLTAIGALAGGIAHDFNNLLSVMLGSAQLMMMKTSLDKVQEKHVNVILKMIDRGSELTEQLLAFARKGNFQFVPLDMHKLIQNVLTLLSRTVDKRIAVKCLFRTGRATILGDPGQIENCLLNIAINSCDAMPQGGTLKFETATTLLGEEYCRTHKDMTPGEYLTLTITDTGIGMNEETMERIFEPFFTTKPEGTGLGLASTFGIVKIHKGEIEVESKEARGTRFIIHLPLVEEEVADIPETSEPGGLVRGEGHILVVDDEDIIREVTSDALRMLGYDVSVCKDGATAVEFFRSRHASIDLVILDLVMPNMNGWTAFRKMKEIDPNLKVLLSSGFAKDSVPGEARDEGMAGFLKKPVEIVELSNAVSRGLALRDKKTENLNS